MRAVRVRVAWVVAAIALSLAIGGCALKDAPSREEVRQQGLPGVCVPDGWQGNAAPGVVLEPWLGAFGDPRLDELVGDALQYNPDLHVAAARVEQAAANVKAAGGRLLPAVNAFGKGGGKLGGDFTGTSGALLSRGLGSGCLGPRSIRQACCRRIVSVGRNRLRRGASIARRHTREGVVRGDRKPSATRHRATDDRRCATGGCARATSSADRHRKRTRRNARAADAANRARLGAVNSTLRIAKRCAPSRC